jgi:uncharacterized protein (DUF1800 family)
MSTERNFQAPPSLAPYIGTWDKEAVKHLLRRTMFGAKKDDISYFTGLGLNGSINQLLDTSSPLPAPPVKEYAVGNALMPDTLIGPGETWVNDPNNDGTIASLRRGSFKKWWVGNMINQERTLRENMCIFWHNHFSTETNDVSNGQYIYKHHNLIRSNALGNIKSLTRAMSIDPAMLVYLNGQNNNKAAPDENYSREIQELFVIGKGPNADFSESDVKEAAKLLTGWRINATKIESFFDPNRHDSTNKQFSSFYGNKIITGRTGATAGDLELTDLINMLFANDEAALFLCRKLYIWFIYYKITPEVEAGIIAPLAKLLRDSNYEVKPVLKALLSSDHFYDMMNRGCQIKSPIDMMIGLLREFEVKFPAPDMFTTSYGVWNQMLSYFTNLQQNLGDPPDVSGWKAYYQQPGFYEYWVNTDTLPKRIQYLEALVTSGYTVSGFKVVVDGVNYVRKMAAPRDPNKLIDELADHILGIPISAQHKAQLKRDILLSGQSDDLYWATAWDLYLSTPSNAANTKYVTTAITNLIKYMVGLPEYQLC